MGPLAPIGARPMADTIATLIPLAQVDPALVERLLDHAFGEDRHGRTAYKLRDGADWLPALSFAALDEDGMLAGTIQLWPVALTDSAGRAHPMLMVGPVAVMPELQDQGFGRALMAAYIAALESAAPPGEALPQVLIGDEPYYGRWSFTADHSSGWSLPGPCDPARLLVRCDNPAILPKEGILGPWRG